MGTTGQRTGGAPDRPLDRPGPAAVVFDVDGTLAETERDGHRIAFNEAFVRHGLDITWEAQEYGELLRTAGGRERLAGYLHAHGFGPAAEGIAAEVHRTKTLLFREQVLAGGLAPRPGVLELVDGLVRGGVRIAVATTGRRSWAEPLVRRLLGSGVVEVLVTGDDVGQLKPDPEVYLRALRALRIPAEHALAVEDSAVGLRAASRAGLATVVVTNPYTADQDFRGAAAVLPAFDRPQPLSAAHCVALHRHWWAERGLR
jgi:HAD superfamily hydrolase (TIGR01509 family)